MRITGLKTNRLTNPLGYMMKKARISYIVEETAAKKQQAAQVLVALDPEFETVIFDSGRSTEIDSISYELPIELKSCTRYYWKVRVWADNGDEAQSECSCTVKKRTNENKS